MPRPQTAGPTASAATRSRSRPPPTAHRRGLESTPWSDCPSPLRPFRPGPAAARRATRMRGGCRPGERQAEVGGGGRSRRAPAIRGHEHPECDPEHTDGRQGGDESQRAPGRRRQAVGRRTNGRLKGPLHRQPHILHIGNTLLRGAISHGQRNNSASFSDGFIQPRVCRGRSLSTCATRFRCRWLWTDKSLPLGKY